MTGNRWESQGSWQLRGVSRRRVLGRGGALVGGLVISPLVALAACDSGSRAPSGGTAAQGPVTLELWHDWGTTGGGGLAMVDHVDEYQRRKPNVTISNVADAGRAKFVTALASDTVPDLFKLNAPEVIEFGEQNALLPLDDVIRRDKWDMKQYFDFAVQQTSYKGKVLSITHHPDIRNVFWSKKLYREAGLDENKPPQSWAELELHAQRLLKRDGNQVTRFGFVPSWTANLWLLQYWQANGATILSDDGRKVAFNVPAAVEATSWVVKVTDTVNGGMDAVNDWNTAANVGGSYRSLARERVGLLFNGNWCFFPVSVENATLPIGVQGLPGGPGAAGKSFVFGGGTMVGATRATKQAEATWEYLKFVGSKDGQYLVQKRSGDVAGHREAANLPDIVNENLGRKEILALFEKANGLSYVPSPAVRAVETVIGEMQTKLLKRELAPKDAVADAAQQSQQQLDDYWARQGR
ncbi:MAG: extracellular solute-binding protein [Chloroflexota bacterium]|nr:extracellular solute-binding protein [Chloroflexota bacterium]